MDLFQGDYAPDHLFSVEFFLDARRCLKSDGSLILNAIFDNRSETPNRHLLATVASVFDGLLQYKLPGANAFLVASRVEQQVAARIDYGPVPPSLLEGIQAAMRSGAAVDRDELAAVTPITDERNIFRVIFADLQLRHRRQLASEFPARVLLN